MSPSPASNVPTTSITLTSNRSMRYPTNGAPRAASSLESENGSEVAARLRLSSVRTGRKYRVNPVLNNPPLTASWTQPIATIHQP